MTLNDDDRTSAIGLARYAREYFDAAIAADNAIGKGYKIHAPPPVMFLVAHSIELALKAYLRDQGLSVDDLRERGHRLEECWQLAIKHGVEDHVQLTKEDLSVLQLISDLHASTELRYIQTGFKRLPVFGPLQQLARKLLDTICPLVGYRGLRKTSSLHLGTGWISPRSEPLPPFPLDTGVCSAYVPYTFFSSMTS